ncbi:fibronectin type III domain-containing protein [Enterococcus lactis]|uniref:fibronectin type III domain-containing protein n=1 Tax=Enterococcus lactis TaxID=357441 RepID=UPI0034E93EC5
MSLLHPNAPQNVTGVLNADGSASLSWDAVPKAKSYIPHYTDANQTDPHDANKMGYTETNSWTLSAADMPHLEAGDEIRFYIQTYNVVGQGANDIEKARYLHDGEFLGSAWSRPVVLIKK